MKKPPKGTTRGVFVVDKEGKVLAAEAGVDTTANCLRPEKGVLTVTIGTSGYCRGRQKDCWF